MDLSYLPEDGLFDGNLGMSIYHFYHFMTYKDVKSYNKGVAILNKVVENLETESTLSNISISYGLSGLGYTLSYLKELDIIDIEIDDIIPGFDQLIYELSLDAVHDGNLGFSNGVSGVLHYFSRISSTKSLSGDLIDRVMSRTLSQEKGFHYPSEPVHLVKLGITQHYINFSMSHGLSGLINVLLNYYQDAPNANLRSYLLTALDYILAHKKPIRFNEGEFCIFPSFIKDPDINDGQHYKEWYKSRLAWCIGDLNMAYLFTKAGMLLNEKELLAIGNETGQVTTKRKHGVETKVDNPFFCHGTSGLAAVYKKLYQMTASGHYHESYRYWLDETNTYFASDPGYGKASGALLNGSAGAKLFLLDERYNRQINNWTSLLIP
ncbi:MAG: Lanthionine synthetase family protein [Mucilaginibacter sp.]|nr:Lanthionine synthetase family protein [Mucilaginibacter sp.]